MLLRKLKTVAAAVLAVVAGAGAGSLAYQGLADEPPAKDGKQTDKPKRDREAILGTWEVVKFEVHGKDATETEDARVFRSAPWTITKNKIVLKEGVSEMMYELDPFAEPKAIDLDNGGDKKFACVYSLDSDMLKICSPLMPGGSRPTEVASKKGSGTRLLVLKRPAKDK
jgi:uncharacterized protein (TIGR03067 family)